MKKASDSTAMSVTKAALTVLLIIPLLSIIDLFAGMPVDEIFGLDVSFPIDWLSMVTWGLYRLASWWAPVALAAIVIGLSFPVLLVITLVRLYVKPRLLFPALTLGYFISDFVLEVVLFCRTAAENSLSLSLKMFTLTFILDATVIALLAVYIVLFRKNRARKGEKENG